MIKQTQSLFYLIFFVSINLFGRVLPNDVVWNESETGYFTIKDNNIVLVSTRGKEDKVILSSSQVNNLEIESFSFSQSKNKILIFTQSVKVWRYNTRGDYWVYDFKKNEIQNSKFKLFQHRFCVLYYVLSDHQ